MSPKTKKTIAILAASLLLLLVGAGGYWYWDTFLREVPWPAAAIGVEEVAFADGSVVLRVFVPITTIYFCSKRTIVQRSDGIYITFFRSTIQSGRTHIDTRSPIVISNPNRIPVYITDDENRVKVWPVE